MDTVDNHIPVVRLENKDEAQAMADFLWNEMMRHFDDAEGCAVDLRNIKLLFGVEPRMTRKFVEVPDAKDRG